MSQTSPPACPSSASLTRGLAIFLLLNALRAQRLDLARLPGRLQGDRAAAQLSTCCASTAATIPGARWRSRSTISASGEAAADLQRGLLRPQRQVPVSAVLAVRPDGDAGGGAAATRAHHRSGHLRLADGQRHHRLAVPAADRRRHRGAARTPPARAMPIRRYAHADRLAGRDRVRPRADLLSAGQGILARADPGLDQRPVRGRLALLGDWDDKPRAAR